MAVLKYKVFSFLRDLLDGEACLYVMHINLKINYASAPSGKDVRNFKVAYLLELPSFTLKSTK